MTTGTSKSRPVRDSRHASTVAMPSRLALAATLALTLAGLQDARQTGTHVAGWSWPIRCSAIRSWCRSSPQTLQHRGAARRDTACRPRSAPMFWAFADQARASDAGNSRLVIAAPSGSSNEVAAMQRSHEIGALLTENGFTEAAITVEAYRRGGASSPPVQAVLPALRRRGPRVRQLGRPISPREPDNLPYAELRLRDAAESCRDGRQSGRSARPAHDDARPARAPSMTFGTSTSRAKSTGAAEEPTTNKSKTATS